MTPTQIGGTSSAAVHLDHKHAAHISDVQLLPLAVHGQLADLRLHSNIRSQTGHRDLSDHLASLVI